MKVKYKLGIMSVGRIIHNAGRAELQHAFKITTVMKTSQVSLGISCAPHDVSMSIA